MKKASFILILLLSCSQKSSAPFSESEKRQVEIEVAKMLDQYFNDIKNKGLTAEFKYLDSSSDFFWVPPGYTEAINYDSVKTAINNNAAKFTSVNNTWTTLEVKPLSPELASYTGNINSVIVDTSGTKMEMYLIETGIVIKRDSGWKLLSGQTNIIR